MGSAETTHNLEIMFVNLIFLFPKFNHTADLNFNNTLSPSVSPQTVFFICAEQTVFATSYIQSNFYEAFRGGESLQVLVRFILTLFIQ